MSADFGVTEMNLHPDKTKLRFEKEEENGIRYVDEEGTEYLYRKDTGAYIGFSKPYLIPQQTHDPTITKDEAIFIADSIVSRLTDISKYERTYAYPAYYSIDYFRLVGPYRTNDTISVSLTPDGKVNYVGFSNIGKYDSVADLKIDEKAMDDAFYAEFHRQFGNLTVTGIKRGLSYKDSTLMMAYGFVYNDANGNEQTAGIYIPVPV